MTLASRLFLYSVVLFVGVMVAGLVVNRGFKKIHWSRALLWITSVAMIGVVGEIFADSIYNALFGTPLWRYNFLPINHAYTSKYAPILWGIFGFFLYITHHKYERWTPRQLTKLSVVFAFEALAIEAAADLISKPILGNYIFYYYPNGLWHISAFQNAPFYFFCGSLIIQTIHWFKTQPYYFTHLAAWVTIVTVYLR
jgi:hypothetical protein